MPVTTSVFKEDLFSGKTAVVTGGGSGICLGMASALARHGCNVALIGRTQAKLDSALREILSETKDAKALALACDVRDAPGLTVVMKKVAEAFGSIDFLICGAAGNFLCSAEDLSTNAFKTVIDIDLIGTFNTCKAALPYLKHSRGSILNVTATLHYKGTPFMAHACAAKAGVDALTRVFALEWGRYGIRVNGIAPGPIDETKGMANLMPDGARDAYKETIPLSRFGRVTDIAYATLYLLSEAAALVTGEIHVVDGGEWLASAAPLKPSEQLKLDMARKREAHKSGKSKL
ncbi:hypothetical protein HDU83_006738 [Entophlyctis luteolus]|nr:hypothetical protein HDU82_007672 [Entophlyctis luteolus]KAJ3353456.1 hypothetical protein HDU83_006738 [Entophlyctis luteolus]KAJ3391956.1 hypothetical protein HDU84_005104 [Entophlyctis sp. JEL0112]